ncbi:MAG: C25 family cysteine peptidase [Candidatus Stygibacter australis]|nr:C25 family cysteine peptidase [Candidatus Stygibacter australis]MDP8321492.1 C25 family cysteine peptidase [Candidatus Stygibacter australis]
MTRKVMLLSFLLLVFSLQGVWHNVNETNSETFTCNQLEQGITQITFQLDGFELESLSRSGESFQKISHPEAESMLLTGMPDLPQFTTLIAVPTDGEINIDYTFTFGETLSDISIYPTQEPEYEFLENKDIFSRNSEYYNNGTLFPEEKVITASPAVMRDLRIIPVSFCPFTYNAATRELSIASEIQVQISTTGTQHLMRNTISRAFEPIYKSMILNYEDFIGRPEYQQPTLVFIISDQEDALETLEYLKDWKRQKGYNVVVATTSETGTTTNSIKAWIQDAYDNWENPPEYICFCGDANGSYELATYGNGDHPYTELAGNDFLEDVISGRLSFGDIGTFQVMVAKILNYEKEPFMGSTDWYEHAVLAGDTGISGPSMQFTCESIKEMMLDFPDNYNTSASFTEIYGGSFPSSINAALNNGVSYMVYRGWMGMSGWSPGNQTNSFMLPFATILTCGTGGWTGGTSDSETFSRMGTVTNPTGAIGTVGTATAGTHSCFNNALTLGIYGGIFRDSIFTMGGATTRGKYYLYETFPQNPSGFVETYHNWANLIGEPSLCLWTDVPEEMHITYDSQVALGTNYLSVNVKDASNTPIPGAWVTISNESESFFTTGFCSETGDILLDIASNEIGEYDIVVTYHDFIPHLGTIEVQAADQYVDVTGMQFDDSAGNGDGILNAGETVVIIPTLTNLGSQPVNDVNVTCQLIHNYLSLNTTEMSYGNIASGATAEPAAGIEMTISPAACGGMQGLLVLNVSDDNGNNWTNWYYLNITGVNLFASEYEVVGGGILEPTISSEIFFTLENMGQLSSTELTAELTCQNPRLIITDGLAVIDPIASGGSGNNSNDVFGVTPSATIIPGSQLTLEIHLSNAEGFSQTCHINVPVGEVEVTDPFGPDEYGYWCYDDGDLGYENCPEYNWIEIDPDLGGNGTIINLNDSGDNGDSEVIALPDEFTFSFYGVQYDQITVCSNGFIAPGEHDAPNFMNHPLPGPEGPSPMIAAFWDDLAVNSGNVCYYYDDIEHIYVVEWSECNNGDTGADETFQIILYDPLYYQTMTDDSLIKIQYMDITNNNAGSYPANHGQYCTVGLESEGAQMGMTYTFNNTYPDACKELGNEMAILFSPPQYPEFGPYLEMVAYDYISGDDQFIEAGETVDLSITIANQGAEAASDVSVQMEIDDPWFTLIDDEATIDILPAIGTIELIDEFSFSVDEQVPDDYNFTVTFNMTTVDNAWFSSISLTAHWINAFLVDQDSIDVVLGLNLTTERTFNLSNTSANPVDYYLRMDDQQPTGRDISGSFVHCDSTVFHPGEEQLWRFIVHNGSSSNEWVNDVWLTFPPGVSVVSATNAYGGTGGYMEWDGTTGDDVTVNWHGEEPNGWGVLRDDETAGWNVVVQISENFASDIQVGWEVGGDGYGNPPHSVIGELNFNFPIQWINLNTSYGSLEPGESDDIIIYYDTNDMETGEYDCSINILSDSWFSKIVNTHLTVVTVDEDDNDIHKLTQLLGNYPNPFNPSTAIKFNLAEDSFTELNIYNSKGQKVCTLLQEQVSAGTHEVNWNGRNDNNRSVSSGVYYLKLKTGDANLTQKLLLLK